MADERPAKLQDALAAIHHGQFIPAHELLAQLLIVFSSPGASFIFDCKIACVSASNELSVQESLSFFIPSGSKILPYVPINLLFAVSYAATLPLVAKCTT